MFKLFPIIQYCFREVADELDATTKDLVTIPEMLVVSRIMTEWRNWTEGASEVWDKIQETNQLDDEAIESLDAVFTNEPATLRAVNFFWPMLVIAHPPCRNKPVGVHCTASVVFEDKTVVQFNVGEDLCKIPVTPNEGLIAHLVWKFTNAVSTSLNEVGLDHLHDQHGYNPLTADINQILNSNPLLALKVV